MLTKRPFLTGFPTLLSGSAPRPAQQVIAGRLSRIRGLAPGPLARLLSGEIPLEMLESHRENARRRTYCDVTTFWTFLSQTLSEDASCARAVAGVQEWRRALGQSVPGAGTGSYVDARIRLPVAMLKAVHQHVYSTLSREQGSAGLWRGLRPKAVDGTSALAPDTPENQLVYPQPATQAEGCGFPALKLTGLVDLCHGGLPNFASGKENSGEMRGYDLLENYLIQGDLLVGDRLYPSYEVIARLKTKGVEFTGRNHQARKVDFRRGRRLGPDERLQEWVKPTRQPRLSRLSKEEWDALPEKLEMRIIRTHKRDREGGVKKMYVVTTLVDAEAYPAGEVASIYAHRWEIELRFRDIKTTMGMEMLRTRTPEMLEKELLMNMIAYNLVKLLMFKAGAEHGASHRRISFKGVLQVLAAASEKPVHAAAQTSGRKALGQAREALMGRIAEREIRERPGRNEPRKKKRRPKSFGWIQRPRHLYLEKYTDEDPPIKILDAVA